MRKKFLRFLENQELLREYEEKETGDEEDVFEGPFIAM